MTLLLDATLCLLILATALATVLGHGLFRAVVFFIVYGLLLSVTALIGLWMLGRDENWHQRLGLPQHTRPGGVMASFGRVLPPIGFLVGVYLVYVGADRPGGAFQGGTVLAAVGLVAALAGLIRPPRVSQWQWRAALVFGPLAFLVAGVAGAVLGHGFLTLPQPVAANAIFAIEAALAISIAVTLAFLVIGPPQEGHSE